MVQRNCRVVFDSEAAGGSWIEQKTTGEKHKLYLRGGVFILPVWITACPNAKTRSGKPGQLGNVATKKAFFEGFGRQVAKP